MFIILAKKICCFFFFKCIETIKKLNWFPSLDNQDNTKRNHPIDQYFRSRIVKSFLKSGRPLSQVFFIFSAMLGNIRFDFMLYKRASKHQIIVIVFKSHGIASMDFRAYFLPFGNLLLTNTLLEWKKIKENDRVD